MSKTATRIESASAILNFDGCRFGPIDIISVHYKTSTGSNVLIPFPRVADASVDLEAVAERLQGQTVRHLPFKRSRRRALSRLVAAELGEQA